MQSTTMQNHRNHMKKMFRYRKQLREFKEWEAEQQAYEEARAMLGIANATSSAHAGFSATASISTTSALPSPRRTSPPPRSPPAAAGRLPPAT